MADNESNFSQEEFDLIFEKYSRITGKAQIVLDNNEKLEKMVRDYKKQHGEDIPDAEVLIDFVPYLLEKLEGEKKSEE